MEWQSRILGELLVLQKWAAGEPISTARVFGLLNGFETVIREEFEAGTISESDQDAVEDILEEVDQGRISVSRSGIKDLLRAKQVSETKAIKIMQLCRLQSRFSDAIAKVAGGYGGAFSSLKRQPLDLRQWTGSLFYMELVDGTKSPGEERILQSVYAPAIPRVGDFVTPESGTAMVIESVEFVAATTDAERFPRPTLAPYVVLVPVHDDAPQEIDDE